MGRPPPFVFLETLDAHVLVSLPAAVQDTASLMSGDCWAARSTLLHIHGGPGWVDGSPCLSVVSGVTSREDGSAPVRREIAHIVGAYTGVPPDVVSPGSSAGCLEPRKNV